MERYRGTPVVQPERTFSLPRVMVDNLTFFQGPRAEISSKTIETLNCAIEKVIGPIHKNHSSTFLRETGFPSPFLRINMSPPSNPDSVLQAVYDIDTRPEGLGMLIKINPQTLIPVKTVFNRIASSFDKPVCIATLPNSDRAYNDDGEFLGEMVKLKLLQLDRAPIAPGRYLIWPRGNTIQKQDGKIPYQKDCLAPLTNTHAALLKIGKGEKIQGSELVPFVAKKLQPDYGNAISISSFVKTTKHYDSVLYHPKYPLGNNQLDYMSLNKMRAYVEKIKTHKEAYFVQDYVEPGVFDINGIRYQYAFSLFASLDFKEKKYKIFAGMYVAHPLQSGPQKPDPVIGPLIFSQNTASQRT